MKVAAKKSLGQNFLVNPGVLERIAAAAYINKSDTVLEVGPGTGNLTQKLAATGARILAVEKDHRLIEPLKEKFSALANVQIVENDILKLNPSAYGLAPSAYKIVANLPYYITSHFLRTVFEKWPRPSMLVLMVQKEVARRLLASPPDMNLLALSVQYHAAPELVMDVSRGSFRPVPNVDSAVIKLVPNPPTGKHERDALFKLIKAGFASKRKQLAGTLAGKLGIERKDILAIFSQEGLDPGIRPERLTLAQWETLLNRLKASGKGS